MRLSSPPREPGQPPPATPPRQDTNASSTGFAWSLLGRDQAGRLEDDLADGPVVADVAGAAADVLADGLLDRVVDVGLGNRAPPELVEQAVGGHQEARRGIAALKGEVLEEGL